MKGFRRLCLIVALLSACASSEGYKGTRVRGTRLWIHHTESTGTTHYSATLVGVRDRGYYPGLEIRAAYYPDSGEYKILYSYDEVWLRIEELHIHLYYDLQISPDNWIVDNLETIKIPLDNPTRYVYQDPRAKKFYEIPISKSVLEVMSSAPYVVILLFGNIEEDGTGDSVSSKLVDFHRKGLLEILNL